MSDEKENYSELLNQLCDEIGKKSFNAYISIRYSKKIKKSLWKKYVVNGIPIPDNVLYNHYPSSYKNHMYARMNVLNAQSSVNTQRDLLMKMVNCLNTMYGKEQIESNDENTIIHNGSAYKNSKKWENTLLEFTGGCKNVIKSSKTNKKVLIFYSVDRFSRNFKIGSKIAKRLTTDRGIILVFLGNHLIINSNDMKKKTQRYTIFENCLQMAQYYSDEISRKMLQRNEAKREKEAMRKAEAKPKAKGLKRKTPSKSHDDVNMLHNKCSVETHSSNVNYIHKKQRNNTDDCRIYRNDFDKSRSPDDFCNNCGECIINHKINDKKNDLFSFSSFFHNFLKF
jgi:DNA invertase Pin-like site-specific DNA recombinase